MRKRSAQIIAVCGGSGSGKSTLARKFVGAAVIATDHFYKSLDKLDLNPDGSYDFDHPSAVDLEACADACVKASRGEDVWIPVYDMRTCRRMGNQLIPAPNKNIVIVEGIFAFHSPLDEVCTLKIFIDTPADQRMARRIRRDVERGRNLIETIKHSIHVEEAYTRYIEPMRQLADLVLMGDEIKTGITS
jgi:uridine kinase